MRARLLDSTDTCQTLECVTDALSPLLRRSCDFRGNGENA